MKIFSSLQNSILFLLFFSLLISMVISGVSLDFLIEDQFNDKTNVSFSSYTSRAQKYLNELERRLESNTKKFSSDEKLISKINFISEYATPEDYDNMIYDNEKKKLAKKISSFSKIAQLNRVRIYDSKGMIIAFADNQKRDKKYGFLTYNNGEPEILSLLDSNTPYYNYSFEMPYWKKHLTINTNSEEGISYIEDNGDFNITFTLPLKITFSDQTVKSIGYILASISIKYDIFEQVASNNAGFNLIISENGYQLGQNPASLSTDSLHNSQPLSAHSYTDTDELFLFNHHLITSHSIELLDNKNLYLVFGIHKKSIANEINQVRQVIVFVFIFIAFLTITVALIYFKTNIGRSIKNITQYADEIKLGRYNAPIPFIKETELKNLTEALRLASEQVQDREQDLLASQNILEERVEERTHELKVAKEEADKANVAKSQFLSSMSHELRTPLNAILGFSQILESVELNAINSENVQEIKRAGYHLLDLINQILDLSQIETGHLSLDSRPLILSNILSECISQIDISVGRHKDVKIINTIDDKSILVFADSLRLRQVFINLLSNAVKYNRRNGTVTIFSDYRADKKVLISITDTGKGIAKNNIGKLFDPFERLDFKNGIIEGTGIGLTVTKQLVEAMDGEIGVISTEGQGSTFWFALPEAKHVESLSQDADSTINTVEDINQSSSKIHTVLYIEDNPANLRLITRFLSLKDNISVLNAKTAEEGLTIAEEVIPDIILMDINLPGINGYAALKSIKEIDRISGIPVIALSANAMASDIEKGHKAGFCEYLTKPINLEELAEAIYRELKIT